MAVKIPLADEDRAKEIARAKRNESRTRFRKEQEEQALLNIERGIGFSSAKTLAKHEDVSPKTIWIWAADPENPFPKGKRISANTTRWDNAEIKRWKERLFSGEVTHV